MGDTIKDINREEVGLAWVNVGHLMPIRLSDTGNSHETIFGSAHGKSWRFIVIKGSTVRLLDGSCITKKDAAHQDLTLEKAGISFRRVAGQEGLSHDSTKGMSGKEPVVTSETIIVDLVHNGGDVFVNGLWIGRLECEIWDTNPSLVASFGGLKLECLGDLRVLTSIVVGTLNPNDGDWCAIIGGLRCEEDNALSDCHR